MLPMLPIPQVDLEIVDRHGRTGRVQFPRTVMAADSREVLIFYPLAWICRVCVVDGGERVGVNGCVAHYSFEGVRWIGTV